MGAQYREVWDQWGDVGRVPLRAGMTHAQRLWAEPTDGIFFRNIYKNLRVM